MANRKSGTRQNMPNKTIDLKANKVEDETAKNSVEKAEADGSNADVSVQAKSETLSTKVSDADKGKASTNEKLAKGTGENSDKPTIEDKKPDLKIKNETASVAVHSTKSAKSGGFGSMLLSAVLGGGVALGGASLLNQNSSLQFVPVIGGLFQGSNESQASNAKIETLTSQLAEMSSQIDALKSGAGSDPAAQEALNIAKSAEAASNAVSSKIADLANRLDANPTGVSIDLDGLKASIASDQSMLLERVSALEKAGPAALPQAIQDELSELKEQAAKLVGLEQASQKTSQSLLDMEARVKAVETSINDTVLPSMESVQAAAGAAVESQKVARSVSARALGAVLENGGSFAGELAAAEALIGQSENITALKSLAGKGISTQAALAADFKVISDRIISVDTAGSEDQSFVGKLMSSAKTLVKVRPAGPIDGETNTAIVSRISASLAEGKLAEALAQWNTLGAEAKTASADWEAKAQDRVQAETHLNNIIGELGLSSPNQG